jgi:hypothetical protein
LCIVNDFESESLNVPVFKLDSKISAIKIVANVLLSKSQLFFERHPFELIHPVEESPPPLGFEPLLQPVWKQTIVIKTKKLKMCSLFNYYFVVKS